MKTALLDASPASVETAAKLLVNDEVVALPTETVYGLAANAFSVDAVTKIFSAKERPTFDPLIVHISEKHLSHSAGTVNSLIEAGIMQKDTLDSEALASVEKLMRKYWPGPLTLVLPRGDKIPYLVTAGHPTVGLRCPAHPLFQAVLSSVPFPLAAPSANRFGRISPTQASDVMDELDGRIPAVLDGGNCTVGLESTIIQVKQNPLKVVLLRPGKISSAELSQELKLPIEITAGLVEQNQSALAPGMLDEHYAPKKPLYLLDRPFALISDQELSEVLKKYHSSDTAILSMGPMPAAFERKRVVEICELSAQNNSTEMARQLYHALRILDANPAVSSIVADIPDSNQPLSAAIRDRLKRASRNKPPV